MTVQLFGSVPVLRCIPRCASGMPLRPGLGTAISARNPMQSRQLISPAVSCVPKPYCSGYPFVAGSIIIYLRSQKDRIGKKDRPNRKAMNLLYKKALYIF